MSKQSHYSHLRVHAHLIVAFAILALGVSSVVVEGVDFGAQFLRAKSRQIQEADIESTIALVPSLRTGDSSKTDKIRTRVKGMVERKPPTETTRRTKKKSFYKNAAKGSKTKTGSKASSGGDMCTLDITASGCSDYFIGDESGAGTCNIYPVTRYCDQADHHFLTFKFTGGNCTTDGGGKNHPFLSHCMDKDKWTGTQEEIEVTCKDDTTGKILLGPDEPHILGDDVTFYALMGGTVTFQNPFTCKLMSCGKCGQHKQVLKFDPTHIDDIALNAKYGAFRLVGCGGDLSQPTRDIRTTYKEVTVTYVVKNPMDKAVTINPVKLSQPHQYFFVVSPNDNPPFPELAVEYVSSNTIPAGGSVEVKATFRVDTAVQEGGYGRISVGCTAAGESTEFEVSNGVTLKVLS